MNTATFPCPHCASPLRIQDRAFTGKAVGCPDCGERIEVTLDRNKEPVAHKVSDEAPKTPSSALPTKPGKRIGIRGTRKEKPADELANKEPEAPPVQAKTAHAIQKGLRQLQSRVSQRFSGVPAALFSPVGIAWTVAGLVGIILLIMAWPASEKGKGKPISDPAAKAPNPNWDPNNLPFEGDLLPEPPPLPDLPNQGIGDPDELAARFTALHAGIQQYVEQRGHYPPGTVAQGNQPHKERFSWLAELFAQGSRGRVADPQWDQPWNDPLNDRFVRQPIEAYLNPSVAQRVGADRYPATHFAGVAGVGADAPQLPATHPRAGIFGVDRRTRPEDIKDGLANTMMVAGVMNHLGSWAAGGNATVRAFTQEPYFEGPDGFGTGEADGMSVLMADGSVRFLSKNTSPVIVRRMAAMADGWALDETQPGEPGEPGDPPQQPEPPKSQPKDPPAIAHADPQPQQVTTAKPKTPVQPLEPKAPQPEPQEPIDIPAALAVKIVKFEQLQNAPFRELLFQVEELAGVPIRRADDLPGDEAEFWNQSVSLRLKATTVREILEALLKKTSLDYTIETDHIRLHSAP